jgi:hypothetical protein
MLFGMRVNEESTAPGSFVASGLPVPRMSNTVTFLVWSVMVALLISGMIAISKGLLPGVGPRAYTIVALIAPFAFMAFQMRGWFSFNKKIVICVTRDGLTVNQWPGDVFSFGDVRLGLWNSAAYGGTTTGTALHLRCGPHRLVVGGRDHRLAAGAPLDEAPVEYPNAWMSAADFDELLTSIGRRSGLDVRQPAPGQPTRCLLIPSPAWFFGDTLSGSLASLVRPFKLGFSQRALNPQPSMAIDVDDTGIWVIDPNTNTVIVSARLAQVSATPAKHTYYRKSGLTMPVMVVRVPGLQERLGATRPLTIACRERRFSWNTRVPSEPPPAFVVSGADWCTLVEKFGLAPYLAVRDQRRFIKAADGFGR